MLNLLVIWITFEWCTILYIQIVSIHKFKSKLAQSCAEPGGKSFGYLLFCSERAAQPARLYVPMKELINEENPANYRGVLVSEYVCKFFTEGLDEKHSLKD